MGEDKDRSPPLREDRVADATSRTVMMALGVVIRRAPGVTRWAAWSWTVVAVLPGAAPADWAELRRQGDVTDYHAATLPLTLWADQTEAYMINLSDRIPSVYVRMQDRGDNTQPPEVIQVTASPYEAQDWADTGEEIVGKVAMTDGLVAWLRDFTLARHEDEAFVKRLRDSARVDLAEDGIGDARIRQRADVYRAPTAAGRRQQS
jgi:hypothetical protein